MIKSAKYFLLVLSLVFMLGGSLFVVPNDVSAACVTDTYNETDGSFTYCLIEPLQLGNQPFTEFNAQKEGGVGGYINKLIQLFIGIIGVLGVVMIILGGIQYMSTDAISKKEGGKEMITNSVFGLILAIASYVILNTINPQLLEIKLDPPGVQITVEDWKLPAEAKDSVSEESFTFNTTTGAGASATCAGGLLPIPAELKRKNSGVANSLCDGLSKGLLAIQKADSSLYFVITSTQDGSHESLCHKKNTIKSGNCADIALRESDWKTPVAHTDARWGKLCNLVVKTPNLNFLNEATNKGTCHTLRAFQTYANTTAPHLHVMYTGK